MKNYVKKARQGEEDRRIVAGGKRSIIVVAVADVPFPHTSYTP